MGNKLKSGVSRVDARLLLNMLVYIHQHKRASHAQICIKVGVSRATANRMIANARKQYGISIIYKRGKGYSVDDFGVFDLQKIIIFLAESPS